MLLSPSSLREYSGTPSLKSFVLTNSTESGSSRKYDNSNLNGRTPIILIHGINREENLKKDCALKNSEEEKFWCYEYKRDVWNTFYKQTAKFPDFYNKFKVYEYVYPSFQNSISNGRSLASLIQNDTELVNSKIYIISHSYGGLVARWAMNNNINNEKLGKQTINLFTLATPHHGSIGTTLLYLTPTTLTDSIINNLFSDKVFFAALNIVKVYYGSAAYTPGYMDLTWDNFDNGIPQHWIDNGGLIVNEGMKAVNEGYEFKNKIIEYSGGNLESTLNIDNIVDVINKYFQNSEESNLTTELKELFLNNHNMLWFASQVMKKFGENNDSNSEPNYSDSDGMVPRSSATFNGGVTTGMDLNNVDHEQIFKDEIVMLDIISKIVSYTPSGSAPSIPTGVTATAGNGQVNISWTSVSDATSYNIYWSTTSGVTKTTGTKLTGATSPYTHTGRTNGTTYYYVVTAVNSYGESSESSQVSGTPQSTTTSDTTAPSNITSSNFINSGASSTTSTSVTLTLSAADNVGVTGYYASETSTTPSANASGWTSVTSTTSYSASVSFALSSGSATKTVYVWFKDAAGNVSASASDSITLTVSDGATLTDIDGNVYNTVTIGTQVWMKENLKVTKYRDGTAIGTTTPATKDVSGETSPKYQWAYDGNESNATTYGRLYTWYAVTDSRGVCPTGWHLPTNAEWTTLTDYLGGESVAGGKLKEAGTTHWNSPNTSADNSSGFTARPGGHRGYAGSFYAIGYDGYWWSATEFGTTFEWYSYLFYYTSYAGRYSYGNKYVGFSVRCVRD